MSMYILYLHCIAISILTHNNYYTHEEHNYKQYVLRVDKRSGQINN